MRCPNFPFPFPLTVASSDRQPPTKNITKHRKDSVSSMDDSQMKDVWKLLEQSSPQATTSTKGIMFK